MAVIETEADRLNALIDATAQIWLDFQQTHPVPWEGAIDSAMAAACGRIEQLTAEVRECHENINLKADFIDKTINQLADADERIEQLTAEVERLREALENVLAHRYGNWCDIARAALGDTQ